MHKKNDNKYKNDIIFNTTNLSRTTVVDTSPFVDINNILIRRDRQKTSERKRERTKFEVNSTDDEKEDEDMPRRERTFYVQQIVLILLVFQRSESVADVLDRNAIRIIIIFSTLLLAALILFLRLTNY